MRIFIIAGEDSGDLHGSKVVERLLEMNPSLEIRGMGGDKMQAAGMNLWRHYADLAVMGIGEVLKKIFTFKRLLDECAEEIKSFSPDKVLFIDYGGFNLRMAKRCREMGLNTHYYILPKVWAWNEKRVKKIAEYVDSAYVIFPFEESYFRARGVNAKYVGHPVKERIDEFLIDHKKIKRDTQQIALLPGSRKQEIERVLPTLLEYAIKMGSSWKFKLALNSSAKKYIKGLVLPENVELEFDSTYLVVRKSRMAIATSGTVTLETALIGTPQIVCYKASGLNYRLGRMFIKVSFLSPVNLILKNEVVPELIQNDLNVEQLLKKSNEIIDGGESRQMAEFRRLHLTLRSASASKSVAALLLSK